MDRTEFITDRNLALHERALVNFFDRHQRLTIFDVGACEGESSLRYAGLFPHARIFAFEPLPSNAEIIRANLEKFQSSTVQLVMLAVAGESGTGQFHVSSGAPVTKKTDEDWDFGNKSSSLLEPDQTKLIHPWLKFNEVITVQKTTLAAFCIENSIPQIDFLHLDVQGAELDVLKGAENILNNVKAIWLEVETVPLYQGQALKGGIETFLGNRGFVKLLDTCGPVAGDQMWIRSDVARDRLSIKDRFFYALWCVCIRCREWIGWSLHRALKTAS